jgi:hypothetical protein
LYIFAIVIAIIFALFSNVKINQLVAIIIIILLSVGIYFYLGRLSMERENSLEMKENVLESDIKDRETTNEKIFYVDKFPKKLRYLKENKSLMDIITNLRFTLKFSRTRYTDIILNLNKLMKIYIYILSDRYDATEYLPIFTDIRDNIVEQMYSFFMIIPKTLKHTYGLDPYTEIYRSIYDFNIEYRRMLTILEKFSTIYNNAAYVPDSAYKPYNSVVGTFFP